MALHGDDGAAALKILSAGAVQPVLEDLAARMAGNGGPTLALDFATVGVTAQKIASGVPADIAIISNSAMAELDKAGRLAGPATVLGRVGMAVAVRDGVAAPDVGTLDAFKAALLNARSIALTDPAAGGSGGIYLDGLLRRLGIAEAVHAKTIGCSGGRKVAQAVAGGAAEIGITFVSEIAPVAGVRAGALLPAEAQFYNSYCAAVTAGCRQGEAARAVIAALADPAMARNWRDVGFEPASL